MSELENMLRRLLDETLTEKFQPVYERLDGLERGQAALQKGQCKLQQDVSTIKRDVKAVWDDIIRLDNRLTEQEEKTNIR